MTPRGMTTRGKRITALFAVLVALALPKRVECGYPGTTCGTVGALKLLCTPYEVEPFGFYLVEKLLERDVGFAYTSGEHCR
jgi:hypothetical protein